MSPKASKLLERMRRSEANWKRADLDILYKKYGFEITHRTKHDSVKHPDFPQLRTMLPRHRKIAKAYVRIAVELVTELIRLQEEQGKSGEPDEQS